MRINGIRLFNQLDISTKNQIISKLGIGDTIRVQVVDKTSQSLILRLPDGTFINASSMVELNVNLGDFLDLSVNQKTDTQIFVEIVKEDGTKDLKGDEIKSKLQSIDIPVDSKSIEIAKEMIKKDIPLTKENFQKISQFIKQHQQISPEKVTFMSANEIPVNDKNIVQLEQIVQHKALVGERLNQLVEQLNKITEQVVKQSLHSEAEHENKTNQNNMLRQDTGNEQKSTVVNRENSQVPQTNINQEVASQLKNINLKLNGQNQNVHLLEQSEDEQVLSNEKKVPNEINGLKEIKSLNALVKSLFKVIDRTRADGLPQEIQADKVLRELTETLSTIKGEIESLNSDEKQGILESIQDIEDSLHFMEQLNKDTSFVQIPVNINGNNTTVELYVLKDGNKKKKIDPSNATIFLSLFTINLGRIESLVNIRGKSIECTFRSEDEEILTFIKKNSMPLYHLLDAQGYKLTNVMVQPITKSQQANITNVEQIKKQVDKKYSFDTRV